jgi:methylmalonyl-CoA/ethylmalonyl-CoA epimerase
MAGAGIKGLAQVAVASRDPARLAAWYRDVVGLPVLFEASGMTFFSLGNGQRLMVGPEQGAEHGDRILYFEPEDFAAAEAALETAGVAFAGPAVPVQREPGRELALRSFADADGGAVALMGWRPRAG